MFEIVTYGGGGFLQQILNGVAMIFGNGDYIFALKMCATLAALGMLISSAFQGRLMDLKWLLIIIFVYVFAFLPKVTVTITDTVERTPGFPMSTPTVRTVANVPVGVAFPASFASGIRDMMTRWSETVFSMPGDISYRRGGALFAQGIADSATKAKPQDPNLNISLSNFWKDCVFYDMALGFYSMTTLAKQDDLAGFLSTNTAAGRAYEHINANGSKSFEMCRQSISAGGKLRLALDGEVKAQQQSISFLNNFATRTTNANSLITSNAAAMPVAFQYLTGLSYSSSQLLAQTTLANSFKDGLVAFSNSAEASTVMQSYAAAKAEAERNISFTVMGKLAGKMLPLLNILAEGLVYAIAPIVGMMLMFPSAGKVAMGYIMVLLWLALWAPLYAILHFFSMYFGAVSGAGAVQICDAANTCTGHLNMYTMSSLKESFSAAQAISGYLATMVPMIAWMAISRSGAMAAGAVGRVMDGYSQPASHAAMEAAGGNIQMGNMSYQNLQAFQQNTAPSQTSGFSHSNDGEVAVTTAAHGQILNQNLGSTAIGASSTTAVQNATSDSLNQAISAKQQASVSLAEARLAKFSEVDSHSRGGSHDIKAGMGTGYQSRAGDSTTASTLKASADKWADTHLSGTEKEAFLRDVAAVSASVSAGVPPILGAGGRVEASNTASTGAGVSTKVSDTSGRLVEFLTSNEARTALDHVRSASIGIDSTDTRTATESETKGKTATDESLAKAEENYAVATERVETAQRTYSLTHSSGFQVDENQGLAIQQRLIAQLGEAGAKEALNDIARGNHSEVSDKAREVVAQYYASQQPAGRPVNYDNDAKTIEVKAANQAATLESEASATVTNASRDNHAHVPHQNLEGQARTKANQTVSTNTTLHNGNAENADRERQKTTLATINGGQDVSSQTNHNLGDAIKGRTE